MVKAKRKNVNILILQFLAVLLVVLAIIVGMGFSMTGQSDQATQEFFKMAHNIFLNLVRALIVVLGAFFTIRYAIQKKGTVSRFRLISLASFTTMAFIFLVVIPLTTHFWDIYLSIMPFPWTTLPLKLIATISYFDPSFQDAYALQGYTILLFSFFAYQFFVFTGTIFLGRRWHCSMICLYNGCHAESMGVALPLIPQNKKRPDSKQIKPSLKKVLLRMQAFMFSLNMLLMCFWSLLIIWGIVIIPTILLIVVELSKYLFLELLLLMALWIFVGGRGYCYYCPAGFLLGVIGKIVGQRIETNLTYCTNCNACNDACDMSIDIRDAVKRDKPVKTVNCTGCGHCVDSCPTQNLKYATHLMG